MYLSKRTAFRNKHTTLSATVTALAVVASTVLPVEVLAFEAKLASAQSQKLVAPVTIAGRDPYLTQAINSLPNYSYTQTGHALMPATPITKQGNWPKPVILAQAAPVVRLIPTNAAPVVLEGEASYYSRAGCLGCNPLRIMANGQPLDDNALTMAIGANLKHLVGHQARVTNLVTGQSVTVRITDTGGFYQAKYGNRVADLTIGTKQAIGMHGGVGQVRVEVF